jgi:hypothetical protein
MKAPMIPVSWGELIDKITILEIKVEKLSAPEAVANVKKELNRLLLECPRNILSRKDIEQLKYQLLTVNQALWKTEDEIRDKEREKAFDEYFIKLARLVYRQNDERAKLKRLINNLMNSDLIEEKSYKEY